MVGVSKSERRCIICVIRGISVGIPRLPSMCFALGAVHVFRRDPAGKGRSPLRAGSPGYPSPRNGGEGTHPAGSHFRSISAVTVGDMKGQPARTFCGSYILGWPVFALGEQTPGCLKTFV